MPEIIIKNYTPECACEWNEFVENSNEGTIFHRVDFLSYHSASRFNFHHLMFYRKNRLVGILPAVLKTDNGRLEFVSPAGASFGGLIVAHNTDLLLIEEIISLLIQYLKDRGVSRIQITQPPAAYHRTYSAYIPFALSHHGFSLSSRELTEVIHLPSSSEGLNEMIEYSCRKQINKALRANVEIQESKDYETFYEILLENRKRYNVLPTHSLEEIISLSEILGPRMRMQLAYHNNEAVAGTLYFACNPNVHLAFYHCHRSESAHLSATHLLVKREIDWAVESGFRFLDFGTTTINMDIQRGGLQFKESFGAVGDLRDTYELFPS